MTAYVDVPAMSGREWEREVERLAKTFGYMVMHTRAVKTDKGFWTTPFQGDPGYPDMTLVGRGRVLFRELKSGKRARETKEQKQWGAAILANGGDYAVWRPGDLAAVAADLARKAA